MEHIIQDLNVNSSVARQDKKDNVYDYTIINILNLKLNLKSKIKILKVNESRK